MPTYAIGDIQGCFDPFMRLLDTIGFTPDRDRLWLTGDLVNRGPNNLGVLRWCLKHEASVQTVLGNHDLHLMACGYGLRKLKHLDTLQDILRARDRDELLDYVWRQPILHQEGEYLMTHAGVPPRWSQTKAEAHAQRLEEQLRGPNPKAALAELLSTKDPALAAFTRMRTVNAAGRPKYAFKGLPSECPPGQVPWFEWQGRVEIDATLIAGHWAALGLINTPHLLTLDTGCVWGRRLTAVQLDTREEFSVPFKLEPTDA